MPLPDLVKIDQLLQKSEWWGHGGHTHTQKVLRSDNPTFFNGRKGILREQVFTA